LDGTSANQRSGSSTILFFFFPPLRFRFLQLGPFQLVQTESSFCGRFPPFSSLYPAPGCSSLAQSAVDAFHKRLSLGDLQACVGRSIYYQDSPVESDPVIRFFFFLFFLDVLGL